MHSENHPLTVGSLLDTVESQICVYENGNLIVRPEQENTFILSVNNEEVIASDSDHSEDGTLTALAHKLAKYQPDDIVHISDMAPLKKGFQIGFKSIEGFIETINSKEVCTETLVLEE